MIHFLPSGGLRKLRACSHLYLIAGTSQVAQWFKKKHLPDSAGDTGDAGSIPGAGRSLGEEVAAHSSILAWIIPRTEELAGYSPWGHKDSDTTDHIHTHLVVEMGTSKYIGQAYF